MQNEYKRKTSFAINKAKEVKLIANGFTKYHLWPFFYVFCLFNRKLQMNDTELESKLYPQEINTIG